MHSLNVAETLKANPWFSALPPQHFEKFTTITQARSWSAGQVIFREGEQNDWLYLVLAGGVALEIYVPNRGRVTILTLGPDELFGWSAAVPVVQKKTASARALQATQALAIDAAALRVACDQDHDLGYYVYRRLTNIIAGRLSATRLQLLDVYAVEPKG